jgi:hypothetical protein
MPSQAEFNGTEYAAGLNTVATGVMHVSRHLIVSAEMEGIARSLARELSLSLHVVQVLQWL